MSLYSPCNVQNVLVENNWITMSQGATGAYQDGAGNGDLHHAEQHLQEQLLLRGIGHPSE